MNILPEKVFKEALSELLKNTDLEKNIVLSIDRSIEQAKSENLINLYKEIEILENQLIQNLQILLTINTTLNSPVGNKSWNWSCNEKISSNNNIQLFESLKQKIKEAYLAQVLSEHLISMINLIEVTKMNNSDYNNLFSNYNFGSRQVKKEIGKRVANKNIDGKTMAYVFYGNQTKKQIGNAFVNHVNNMHNAIFNDYAFDSVAQFKSNIRDEEGSNFFQLLIDSIGARGGELMLLNGNQSIANVQLNTIQNVSKEAMQKVFEDLNKFKSFINNGEIINKEAFINYCYNSFKNSSVLNEVENEILNVPIEYLKQNLNNINNENIKITFS